MQFCQWALIVLSFVNTFIGIGEASEKGKPDHALAAFIGLFIRLALLYGAGAFSQLWR